MDTQKVEQYAGVVRKVSTGLKVWNIIGIFGNLFVLIGVASTFVPSVQEELAKKGVEHSSETAGVGVAVFLLFLLLCIFATILPTSFKSLWFLSPKKLFKILLKKLITYLHQ